MMAFMENSTSNPTSNQNHHGKSLKIFKKNPTSNPTSNP